MKNDTFSPEILSKVRKGLPQGRQKELAEKHGISQRDVYRILSGYKLKSGKCNIYAVLSDAMQMYIEINSVKMQAEKFAQIIALESAETAK